MRRLGGVLVLVSAVVCAVKPMLGQRENIAETALPNAEVVLIAPPKTIHAREWPQIILRIKNVVTPPFYITQAIQADANNRGFFTCSPHGRPNNFAQSILVACDARF